MYEIEYSIFKFIENWLRVKRIQLIYFIKYSIFHRKILKVTKSQKNKYLGQSVIVFANGPSVREIDPEKIALYQSKGFKVIAVNSFSLASQAEIITPDIMVLSDPFYFGTYSGNKELDTIDNRDLINKALAKIKLSASLNFIPIQYYKNASIGNKYGIMAFRNPFSDNVTDITKPHCYVGMTAYLALAVAGYLGFKNIYISGFDNSWFKSLQVDEENQLYMDNSHFYDSGNHQTIKVDKADGRDVGHYLYIQHFLFRDLKMFRKLPIVNLDKNSLTDAFPKKHNLDVYLENTAIKNE